MAIPSGPHLPNISIICLPLASQPSHTEQALTRGQALHAIAPCRGALWRTYNTPGPLRLAVSQALHRHHTLVPENHAHRRQRMSRMVVCKAPNGTTSSHDASFSPIYCPIEPRTHMAPYNMTWLCWPVEVASLSYLLGSGIPINLDGSALACASVDQIIPVRSGYSASQRRRR
jgi:hypothetical protein